MAVSKHRDLDPVMVGYASSRNITFRSYRPEELGYTWGEWREMSGKQKAWALEEFLSELVDVWIEGDE